MLAAYYLARQVNAAAGGQVIAPWEVGDLPEEWLEGAQALTGRVEQARQVNTVIEGKLAAWRRSHPHYKRS